MCKLVYQMDIQIYENILILRNCSKGKLCRAVSLGLGLKGVKIIAQNVPKFSMHDCLSNGHPSYSFVTVWLEGAENNFEHRESWRAHLSSKFASKDMIKF